MKQLSRSKAAAKLFLPAALALAVGLACWGSAALAGDPIPGVDVELGKNPGGSIAVVHSDQTGKFSVKLGPGDYTISTACKSGGCTPSQLKLDSLPGAKQKLEADGSTSYEFHVGKGGLNLSGQTLSIDLPKGVNKPAGVHINNDGLGQALKTSARKDVAAGDVISGISENTSPLPRDNLEPSGRMSKDVIKLNTVNDKAVNEVARATPAETTLTTNPNNETHSPVVPNGPGSVQPAPVMSAFPGGLNVSVPGGGGDVKSPGVMVRESPTKQSLGTMQSGGGGGSGKVHMQDFEFAKHPSDTGTLPSGGGKEQPAGLEGDPIPGVDVKLGKNPGGSIAVVKTDKNGAFNFDKLPSGQYRLTIPDNTPIQVNVGPEGKVGGNLMKGSDGEMMIFDRWGNLIATPITVVGEKFKVTNDREKMSIAAPNNGGDETPRSADQIAPTALEGDDVKKPKQNHKGIVTLLKGARSPQTDTSDGLANEKSDQILPSAPPDGNFKKRKHNYKGTVTLIKGARIPQTNTSESGGQTGGPAPSDDAKVSGTIALQSDLLATKVAADNGTPPSVPPPPPDTIGEVISGVPVGLEHDPCGKCDQARTTTDRNGSFTFSKQIPGNYKLIFNGQSTSITVGFDGMVGGKFTGNSNGTFSIFDRWGNLIFEAAPKGTGSGVPAGRMINDKPVIEGPKNSPGGFGGGMGGSPGRGPDIGGMGGGPNPGIMSPPGGMGNGPGPSMIPSPSMGAPVGVGGPAGPMGTMGGAGMKP